MHAKRAGPGMKQGAERVVNSCFRARMGTGFMLAIAIESEVKK